MPDCINKGKYVSMVEGLASAAGIQSTPTVKINGQEFDVSTRRPTTWSLRSRRSSVTCRA